MLGFVLMRFRETQGRWPLTKPKPAPALGMGSGRADSLGPKQTVRDSVTVVAT